MAVSYLPITPKVGESYTTPVDVARARHTCRHLTVRRDLTFRREM